ncbi:TetR/AcrR family transcriptional regulator [Conexibacter stalactiti]|uniref:TetR/AcrR family transcriptional regulator n=1 Tax=Conexibacter stalactiti TaxID=1940611 RepID=A0ABU4HM97_9ACTN|nr:TetR/AcrR family transcriptional regulator [Conexibacter stalactiti]MDW5593164.1 TetR/AcrR family transcriptional regulator [Conexibacter stalactiti]MEC5033805.1 TetR/AcrR family transcriptional regulator [Conexibacter stalactiti]
MPSATRRPQSRRAARREVIRDRLLDVVQRLLADGESFTEISVERMVQEAGMSRSTYYVYFEDKGDLLRAWFGEIEAEIAEAVAGWWEIDGDSSRADLRAALARVVEVYHPHAPLMAATYDAAEYDPSVRELVTAMMGANIASLRKHIRQGQAAGFIDPELPAAETAQWLTWMAERAFHVFLRGLRPAQLRTQVDAYTAIVWNTLYAPVRAGA